VVTDTFRGGCHHLRRAHAEGAARARPRPDLTARPLADRFTGSCTDRQRGVTVAFATGSIRYRAWRLSEREPARWRRRFSRR
jgi:hypothetical protein